MKGVFFICLALTFCLNISFIYSQNFEPGKGKALIYFYSKTKVIVRLDTMLLQQVTTPISLKEGKYVVRAWAPTKKLFIDTIQIRENKTTIVSKRLESSKEYKEYERQLATYRTQKNCSKFIPFPLTLGYSGFVLWKYNQNKKNMNASFEKAQEAKVGYENSISILDINTYKETYNTEQSNYEEYRTNNNRLSKTATIIIPVALIGSTALYLLSKKLVKPTYTEVPLLSFNSLNISRENSTTSLGVVLNINR